jgi:hypothetical protein
MRAVRLTCAVQGYLAHKKESGKGPDIVERGEDRVPNGRIGGGVRDHVREPSEFKGAGLS